MTDIQLLGKVAVLADGRPLDPGPDKQRCVLTALAMDVGRVVSVERLTERVWGDEPPPRARATLTSYLSRLRRLLVVVDDADVVRQTGGYVLQTDPSVIDLHRFRDLCVQARTAVDDQRAARLLREALNVWQGEALTGLNGDWAAAERGRLHQERLTAECDLTDVLLRLGKAEDLLADLTARTAVWPLDERVASQYMLALHRVGRTADALAHYRDLRNRLVEELGTDPGAALRNVHQQILSADPGPTPLVADPVVVPRQLPAAPGPFVGRHEHLDHLDTALDSANTVTITAIAGAGGIGKTWLALHWAHRHAAEFPDGQLFVDLRGFSPDEQPMNPAVALRGLLDALGVESGRIPADPHAQAALFRSLVSGKRMLLVLDNAFDTNRARGRKRFTRKEIATVASLTSPLAKSLRSFALPTPKATGPARGPGPLLFDATGTLLSINDEARESLAAMPPGPSAPTRLGIHIPAWIHSTAANALIEDGTRIRAATVPDDGWCSTLPAYVTRTEPPLRQWSWSNPPRPPRSPRC